MVYGDGAVAHIVTNGGYTTRMHMIDGTIQSYGSSVPIQVQQLGQLPSCSHKDRALHMWDGGHVWCSLLTYAYDFDVVISNGGINGEPVLVHGDGTQSRDFTYVETVCAGLYQAFKDQLSSTTPINLAFGGNTSLLNLIKVIEKQIGHKIESRFSEARVGDVKLSQANAERMIQIFPNLKPTSLEEGIKLTLEDEDCQIEK